MPSTLLKSTLAGREVSGARRLRFALLSDVRRKRRCRRSDGISARGAPPSRPHCQTRASGIAEMSRPHALRSPASEGPPFFVAPPVTFRSDPRTSLIRHSASASIASAAGTGKARMEAVRQSQESARLQSALACFYGTTQPVHARRPRSPPTRNGYQVRACWLHRCSVCAGGLWR